MRESTVTCQENLDESTFDMYYITDNTDNYVNLTTNFYGSVFYIATNSINTGVISDNNNFSYCVNSYKGAIF